MKAIMVMFDTLRRKSLPCYGNDWIKADNFKRLAEQTATFDNFYACSLPCMPARRELHTGRYNFLHRSWGPLEPFDDSMPEILKNKGIYTHLVTDHSHYWEDGGATYHCRYNSWEGFRGQEGDRWKAHIGDIEIPEQLETVKGGVSFKHNFVNRMYQQKEVDLSAYKTFEAGLQFIQTNKEQDNWFLQIECFDPHEPFYTLQKYKDLYPHDYKGKQFDWPSYQPVTEEREAIQHVKYEYAALVSMCDAYLGKVLDIMDENDLWKDTMLIVNTDHGFLLGEHEWWGKNIQPFYDEVVHIPFFIWDPRLGIKNERRKSLVQTIDIAPTLLEYFGAEIPDTVQGKPLKDVLFKDKATREGALFGVHGGHVNVTDGRYVYMRAAEGPENKPLYEYTLMPTAMRNFFSKGQLQKAELTKEFEFTKKIPVLKIPASAFVSSYRFGNKLFDLEKDPEQINKLEDLDKELEMLELLRVLMLEADAPIEQYERIGIYKDTAMNSEDLKEQMNNRIRHEELKLSVNTEISENSKKQINFLRDLLPQNVKPLFISEIEAICISENIQYLNEQTVIKLADKFLDTLNIGDRKHMLMNLVRFANKVD